MSEQSIIKQISIGENKYEIDAKYWGGIETSILDDLASKDYVKDYVTKTELEGKAYLTESDLVFSTNDDINGLFE